MVKKMNTQKINQIFDKLGYEARTVYWFENQDEKFNIRMQTQKALARLVNFFLLCASSVSCDEYTLFLIGNKAQRALDTELVS